MSSLELMGVVELSGRAPRRGKGVDAPAGVDPATLGVKGVLLAVLTVAQSVGMRGRAPFCLSWGMFALLFAVNGADLRGTRITAL